MHLAFSGPLLLSGLLLLPQQDIGPLTCVICDDISTQRIALGAPLAIF